MTLIDRVRNVLNYRITLSPPVSNATYRDTEGPLVRWLRGDDSDEPSSSGITINERSGIKISTVWKCVNWRANQFGMLPKKVNERVEVLGRMAQRTAPRHPLYSIVHAAPNPTITSKAFFGLISADLHLWGNSYAYIERGSQSGRLRNLWRLMPDRVVPEKQNGVIQYKISDDAGHFEYFAADDILHIAGLGYDGIQGYSPIRLNMQTLGWNAAAVRYGAQFFKNASRPSGIISIPNPIKPEAVKSLEESLSKAGKESGKLAIIQGALEYKSLTMPQDEAQFIETMQFQEEDICGIMGVPQHKVQILRRSTNNNIEHQGIEAVTDCIQPLAVDVEQAFNLQLLSGSPSSGIGGGTERERFFMECELKALLRGDTAAQTAHLMAMFDRGIYSGNDCADYLGLAPFEGGDIRFINRAYGPVDQAREWTQVSQNNPPAKEEEPKEDMDKETAKAAFSTLFRDAVGRTIARKGDRGKSADVVFRPILTSLSNMLAPFSNIADYIGALGKRSVAWTEEASDSIAADELTRAIETLTGETT